MPGNSTEENHDCFFDMVSCFCGRAWPSKALFKHRNESCKPCRSMKIDHRRSSIQHASAHLRSSIPQSFVADQECEERVDFSPCNGGCHRFESARDSQTRRPRIGSIKALGDHHALHNGSKFDSSKV